MKKYLFKSLTIIALAALAVSCEDDAEVTMLGKLSFPQTFTASTNQLVITEDNDSVKVIDFSWEAVNYGIEAPVTYSLQFALAEDTSGANGWSRAQEFYVGDNVYTAALMGYDLNKIGINALGMDPGVEGELAVRVKSFVDRAAFSNAIVIDFTPFEAAVVVVPYPSLWVPGDYQGWDPSTAPTIVSVDSSGLYEGYIYIPEGGTYEYKYTAQPAWEPMAYGDGGDGTLIEANFEGGNFTAPSAGYYELSANLNDMTWTATKTTWSILGDASPGGWTTDTQMNYDVTNQVWTVTVDMIAAGSFKFRANNAWIIDFGIDENGNLQYADNPLYPYNPNLSNITVPSDGNYTITLDLHLAGQYSFKLKKN
ncbi:MAG: SusE domain-containing protein [Lentimicrobium sp.]|jgi:hypothetical protein|nr:SusE domain-containing protein [Lentimicrobium sp.]